MDRFQAMSVFARVVEAGSFVGAAERLGISNSAASRLVSELESRLGVRLLHRTTRRLSLTESGRLFYERCTQVLTDLEEAEASVGALSSEPRGTLRITCGQSWGVLRLAPAIAGFSSLHPSVRFAVDLSDRLVDLVEEGFDLAVRTGPVASATLVARPLGDTRMIACAAPAYLERHGTPQEPGDLVRHNCIAYAYASGQGAWRFSDRDGRSHQVRTTGTVLSNSGDLAAAIAVRGMGIAFEPDFIVAEDLAAGRLVRVLPDYDGPTLPIRILYPSRRHLSAKVRSFVDFLVARETTNA